MSRLMPYKSEFNKVYKTYRLVYFYTERRKKIGGDRDAQPADREAVRWRQVAQLSRNEGMEVEHPHSEGAEVRPTGNLHMTGKFRLPRASH
jgi:hypothetical protein